MRKCLFFAGIFLLIVHFSNAQETSILVKAIINWKNQNKLWTDEQVYTMTAKFQIQDSLFTSPDLLNESYRILSYMPEADIGNYCLQLKSIWAENFQWNNYKKEIHLINTIDDWITLLNNNPVVLNSFMNGSYLDKNEQPISFVTFIEQLKNRQQLVFLDNGSLLFCINTRDNYYKYKNLKRLK